MSAHRLRRALAGALGLLGACSEPPLTMAPDATVEDAPSIPGVDVLPCNRAAVPVVDAFQCDPLIVTDDDLRPDVPDAARCVPGSAPACRCADGSAGIESCSFTGERGNCFCDPVPRAQGGAPPPHPPRQVAPLSGMRATSQRPTLRWVLPEGVSRARVALCDDRACTRPMMQMEVSGTSWRPAERLRPGAVFWRVTGLRADGTSAWTSATWEFGVRHRDTPTDSVSGPIRDFNGDGVDDLVEYSDRNVWILPGGRDGLPLAGTEVLRQSPHDGLSWGTMGDVDGDGIADLVISTSSIGFPPTPPRVRVVFGGVGCPARRVARIEPALANPSIGFGRRVNVSDFDGDGFGDVVVGGYRELSLYRGGTGALPLHDRTTYREGSTHHLAGVGDVDGDGYGDIVALGGVELGAYELRVFFGNPRGLIDERVQTQPYAPVHQSDINDDLLVDDLSGDGRADFVRLRGASLELYWGGEEGLRLGRTLTVPPVYPEPQESSFGDLDGDGRSEILLRGQRVIFSVSLATQPATLQEIATDRGNGTREVPLFGGDSIIADLNADGFDDFTGYFGYFIPTGDGGVGTGARFFGAHTLHLGGGSSLCAPARMWLRDGILPQY